MTTHVLPSALIARGVFARPRHPEKKFLIDMAIILPFIEVFATASMFVESESNKALVPLVPGAPLVASVDLLPPYPFISPPDSFRQHL